MPIERQLAVMTGTSRDVGEFASYGLAQANYDLVGGYRNDQHAEAQKRIAERLKSDWKSRMLYVEGDINESSTQSQYVDRVVEHYAMRNGYKGNLDEDPKGRDQYALDIKEQGGIVDLLVLSTAGGYTRDLKSKSPEQIAAAFDLSRKINVTSQLELLGKVRPLMKKGSSVMYLTSDPAHKAHLLVPPGDDLGAIDLMGDYAGVAVPKNEMEANLRALIPDLAEDQINAYVLVGNALDGSFVTRVLKRGNPQAVSDWQNLTERGHFPVVINMAADLVTLARGNYPTGHTMYTGVAPRHRLYKGNQLKNKIA